MPRWKELKRFCYNIRGRLLSVLVVILFGLWMIWQGRCILGDWKWHSLNYEGAFYAEFRGDGSIASDGSFFKSYEMIDDRAIKIEAYDYDEDRLYTYGIYDLDLGLNCAILRSREDPHDYFELERRSLW